MRVFALNAGGRSHSAKLFCVDDSPPLEPPRAEWEAADESSEGSFQTLLSTYDGPPPDVVVHRIVHPGPELASELAFPMDERARDAVRRTDLAPLHDPIALEGLNAATERFPHAGQIGVSDIALRDDAAASTTTYAVPYAWRERYGVRRYGFHGISHRDVLDRAAAALPSHDPRRRIVSVHLGSGSSVVAACGKRIDDSTMGMTPLEGLVMGSRAGSIDPGIIFTLLRRGTMDAEHLEHAISKESGLKGLSGISSDIREVASAAGGGNARARLAIDIFLYSLRKAIGAMAAANGGIDVLTFTGPVGEHVAWIRRDVCVDLAFLGIEIDDARNEALPRDGSLPSDASIGSHRSRTAVLVVRTLEEWAMARAAAALVRAA